MNKKAVKITRVHIHLAANEYRAEVLPVAIYPDDTIEAMKRKIVLAARALGHRLCVEELYLYGQQAATTEAPWDVLDTYRRLSDDGQHGISREAIRQLCANIGLSVHNRDEVTTYEEFYSVFGNPVDRPLAKRRVPLGLEWSSGAPPPLFPVEPRFSVDQGLSVEPRFSVDQGLPVEPRFSVDQGLPVEPRFSVDQGLPVDQGDEEKPALAEQKLLFEFLGDKVGEIHVFQAREDEPAMLSSPYFPLLRDTEFNRDALVEQSWEKAQADAPIYDSLEVFNGEDDTELPRPTREGLTSFTIYVLFEKGGVAAPPPPLEIVFKNIHASAAVPMITYVSPVQTMFRLYAPTRTQQGEMVPALSREAIQKQWRDIRRNRRKSGINAKWVKKKHHRIVMMISANAALSELFIDFKDNGVITLYGKSERPVPRDALSRVLGESLRPILEQLNAYLDPTGFHIPIYDDYLDAGNGLLRVENIDYFAEWQMTKEEAKNTGAWTQCVECARALFLPVSVSARRVEVSYVRVPGYRKNSAPAAFVARRIEELRGQDGVEKNIIEGLMRYFPEYQGVGTKVRARARELYAEVLETISKGGEEDMPGCFCRMEMTERNAFRVEVDNISSLHVLPMLSGYLRGVIAISRDAGLLKRVCGFKGAIIAAAAATTKDSSSSSLSSSSSSLSSSSSSDEEEQNERSEGSDSEFGEIRVVREDEKEEESSSDESSSDESSSDESTNNRFRIREGGAKKSGLDPKKWKNWTWRRLEEQAPQLFEKADNYPRQCQGDLKPVILTPDEKKEIDAADADFEPSYTNALEYSEDENLFFICPKYWSVSQNRSISQKEMNANNYSVIDRNVKTQELEKIPEEKEGDYVYQFTAHGFENKVLAPKLRGIKNKETGKPLPCCYVLSKEEEAMKEDIKETKKEANKQQVAPETSYISEKMPPLEKHHFGFLSPQLEIFFKIDRRDFFNRITKRVNKGVPFVLRYGVENEPPKQSFLACFAEIFAFYRQIQTPTIVEFANIVASTVSLDTMLRLRRSNNRRAPVFKSNDVAENHHNNNFAEYKNTDLYRSLDMRSPEQRRFFEETVRDHDDFLEFLRDPVASKSDLWEIFCSSALMGRNINLIILESQFTDAVTATAETVRILCPSEPSIMDNYDVKRDHVILYKVGEYYELLCSFEKSRENKKKDRMEPVFRMDDSGFPPLLTQMPEILRKIHGEMRKCSEASNANKSNANKSNANKSNANKSNANKGNANKGERPRPPPLAGIQSLQQITIEKYVLHWDGQVVGVLCDFEVKKEKKEKEGSFFVPCEPSPLPNTSAAAEPISVVHISAVKWRPFEETRNALQQISDIDKALANCAPASAVVDDEGFVVGILTETGQFVETVRASAETMTHAIGDLDVVEQPNPNDVDRALAAATTTAATTATATTTTATYNNRKKTRSESLPVEIEHKHYSDFRSVVRKRLRDYAFREVRRMILKGGVSLEVIETALKKLVGDSVRFVGEMSPSGRNAEAATVLELPRKNSMNPRIDNETMYYHRLADELVRYDRVRLYMLENTIQFTEIEYRIHDDELVVSEQNLGTLGPSLDT